MSPATSSSTGDRFGAVVAGGIILLTLMAASPLASFAWRGWITPLLTVGLVITLFHNRRPDESAATRRFWLDLTIAAISALFVLLALQFSRSGAGGWVATFVADSLFVGYYLALALAVERKPERQRPAFDPDTDHWTLPATGVFVVGAFVYFIVLPALSQPRTVDNTSTQALFASLDAYLVVRLVHRAAGARGRWRRIYSLLTITTSATLAHALLRLLDLPDGRFGAFLWYLPIGAFFLVARERGQPEPPQPRPIDPSFWPRSGDQAMMLALVAPVIHFSLHQSSLLANDSLKSSREALVLLWTLLLGTIALLQRRTLERKSLRMLEERERLSERLGDAAADLRIIVESRSTAQSLSVTESKLSRALEVCPDAIGISTVTDGRFVEVNPAFETLTGHQKKEILGQTSSELGIWLDPAHRARIVDTVRRDGHARDIELPVQVRSGGQRIVLFSAQPLDIGGEACLIIVGRDVTHLRAVEASKALRARLLQSIHEAVYAVDGDGQIRFWNRGAERLYRWNTAEAQEHDVASLLFPYEPTPLAAARAATNLGSWHGRLSPSTRTGASLTVHSRWTRLAEPASERPWLLVVDTDETVLQALADQLPR